MTLRKNESLNKDNSGLYPADIRTGESEAGEVPLVYVVVLHWQGSHYTRACLASLRALHYPNYKVVLVDNGSPDGSGSVIARQFPEVALVSLADNLGFAGGSNAGIDYCLDRGAHWIWLLNNDTRVEMTSLDLLMAQARENERAGVLGAMVLTGSGEQFVASGIGDIDFIRAKTHLRRQADPKAEAIACEWLGGSNLLLKAEALKEVGRFDEDYFLYFEDTDLCYRLRQGGWQCILVPQARVEHVGSASTQGKRAYWRAYYYTRNRLLFFLKYLSGVRLFLPLAFMTGHLIRHALVLPFRGEEGRCQWKAEYLGVRDYLLKRFGKATCLDWCD